MQKRKSLELLAKNKNDNANNLVCFRNIYKCFKDIVKVIQSLTEITVTKEELEASKIGSTVNSFRKNFTDSEITTAASALLIKWKDIMTMKQESTQLCFRKRFM